MTKEQILAEVLALKPSDRDELAERIWQTIDPADRREIDEAWAREVEQRIAAHERGELSTKPMEEVLERLENRPRR